MRIQKAVIEDTISMKKAGLLLYSMQLALTNVGQTTFGQAKDEEMVRETVDEEEALGEKAVSNQHSAVSQDQTFETQRNGGSGGEEGLRRMDADERGLQEEENRQEVEFVAVPGGYGFERVRLRMEPSGHRAIPPQPAQERRGPGIPDIGPSDQREIGTPPGAAVPQEHTETYAVLG